MTKAALPPIRTDEAKAALRANTCPSMLNGSVSFWEARAANASFLQKPWLPRATKRVVNRMRAVQGYYEQMMKGAFLATVAVSFLAGAVVALVCAGLCHCVCVKCGCRCPSPCRKYDYRRGRADGDEEQMLGGDLGSRSESMVHRADEMRPL